MNITLNHKFISSKYVWSYLYINTLNNQKQKNGYIPRSIFRNNYCLLDMSITGNS